MSGHDNPVRIGRVLVDYSSNGIFPEEESVAATHFEDSLLPGALNALNDSKAALEVTSKHVKAQSTERMLMTTL